MSESALVEQFVGRGAADYAPVFARARGTGLAFAHLNWAAVLAGAMWAAGRGVWPLFWLALAADTLALMLGAAATVAAGSAAFLAASALLLALAGRLLTGSLADRFYYRQYMRWRTDRAVPCGWRSARIPRALTLILLVVPLMIYRATQTAPSARDCRKLWDALAGTHAMSLSEKVNCLLIGDFPLGTLIGNATAQTINQAIAWLTVNLAWFFDAITWTVRFVLTQLSHVFVGTPWFVMALLLCLIAWRAGGRPVLLFMAGALSYLALFGYWSQAMTTLALVSAATFISIVLGLPIGVWCAKHAAAYRIVRPILDVMQTLPSFVYLIPAIAFFSIGKPPAVLATVIFSMPPMIRLTVLGISQVPESVREAATAFGATERQLLWKVELPLAVPSIMAGVNQTILLSLSMSVVAALIGAGGLGYDVLFALQNVEPGRGILAGIAIALCAMIIDRVVQSTRPQGQR
jgi:glycine betaine/proline transport system permease protein